MQLAAAIPRYCICEFGQAYSPLLAEIIDVLFKVEADGGAPIPQGPGPGIGLDPEVERRFRLQGSESDNIRRAQPRV